MSLSNPFLDLKKYEQLEEIEKGKFFKVYKIVAKEEHQIYIAKIFFKEAGNNTRRTSNYLSSRITRSEINDISRNITNISKLHHPSILQFIGLSLTDFKEQTNSVIVTEYSPNGTLKSILDYQKQSKSFSTWDDTKKLINIYGIAAGMSYLHSHDIVHGNLNTQNILMDDFLCPKIDNYYMSKINPLKLTSKVKQNVNNNTKANDVYSFSLIMYKILTNEDSDSGETINIQNESIPTCYRKLIEQCSSKEPSKRPTFDKIIEILRTDSKFITESIEKVDYFDYIQFIDNYLKTFNSTKEIIQLKDFVNPTSKTYIEVNIDQLLNQQEQEEEEIENEQMKSTYLRKITFPEDAFENLEESCQQLVRQADNGDPDAQFLVGKSIFEGSNDFPQNDEIGIEYMIEAIRGGSVESAIYYCQIILDRKLYSQEDMDDFEIILYPLLTEENPSLLTLYGKIKKKGKNFSEAKKYFKKASNAGDAEAMYEYGKILFKKSKELFEKSKLNGCQKSDTFLSKQIKKEENNQQTLITTETDGFIESEIIPHSNEASQKQPYFDDKMISMNGEFDFLQSSSFRLSKSERVAINKKREIRFMKQAANNGDVEAMVHYGLALLKGDGVQKDTRGACHYFKRASEEGSAEGMLNYALILEHGNGVPANKRKAFRLYRIAADMGNIDAMNRYGLMLLSGECVDIDQREVSRHYKHHSRIQRDSEKVDKRKACHYFKASADKGNVDAMLNYGLMLSKGEGVALNKEEACRYLKVAADSGNTEAMLLFSTFLSNGDGVKANKEESCRYCKMAADSGSFKAMHDYGMMLYSGEGCLMDRSESAKYLKMAADRGDADAMLQFGLMLSSGDGVVVNKEAACYYFRMSANKKNIEAMRNYGLMLSKGEGVAMDKKKASFFLKKAADRGNVEAMFNYGMMSKKGEGVPVNKQEACKYFKAAADKGNVKAMLNYGIMLLKGEGVQINKRKACLYIKNAAYKGNVKAMLQYAMMLEKGEGVAVNKDEAQCYYKMAADKGNIEADVYYNIVSEEQQSEMLLLSEQLSEQ